MYKKYSLAVLLTASAAIGAKAPPPTATFSKDVLPIFQKNRQCHRPGQAGPMSFVTYESTRHWEKAMKEAVVLRKTPPWFADRSVGRFVNDPSLKQADIDTVARRADAGALQGDPKDAPRPVQWPEGWHIQPDLVITVPTIEIPAHPKNNVVEWITVMIPTGFTKDTWITSVEIKPEYPEVAHHMCLGFNPHAPDVRYFAPVSKDKPRDGEGAALPDKGPTFTQGGGGRRDIRVGRLLRPGNVVADYRPMNTAMLVPAGSDIAMNLHYTPNGKTLTDHIKIGLTIAKEPPMRRYVSLRTSSPQAPKQFAIPPNDPDWASPPGEATFNHDVELVFMEPHMHARGKDMKYTLEYPDGLKEVILNVPRYDFNWQLGYKTSAHAPKGTKLVVEAHFDNSANNAANPNPNRTVYYGEMTWEEMMPALF